MGASVSRESYLDTGLGVLSDLGYGGLKLAEVCHRLGVTTGSFYHYFTSWSAYGLELIAHWVETRTVSVASKVQAEPDPRRRIDILFEEALMLPAGAEAGIRVWSSIDRAVYEVQKQVDQQRFDMLHSAALEVMGDARQASRFATTAMYLLIGCEQSTLQRVPEDLVWINARVLASLDDGAFAFRPDAT